MLLALALIFSFINTSEASQEVLVKTEQTSIYESPDEQSGKLALAKKGTSLKSSSLSRSGWFKIELPTRIYGKKYGWIKKSEVDPVKVLYPEDSVPSDQKKSP